MVEITTVQSRMTLRWKRQKLFDECSHATPVRNSNGDTSLTYGTDEIFRVIFCVQDRCNFYKQACNVHGNFAVLREHPEQ